METLHDVMVSKGVRFTPDEKRDLNAAENILRKGISELESGGKTALPRPAFASKNPAA